MVPIRHEISTVFSIRAVVRNGRAILLQGGLSLPDRDYYLGQADSMVQIRKRHLAHMAALLKLANIADADAKALRIEQLESRIAAKHWSREDTGQVAKANNPWKRADFERRAHSRVSSIGRSIQPIQAVSRPGSQWQTDLE
jgi:predicted metalloendopeptidase